jgi:hypothetical protein
MENGVQYNYSMTIPLVFAEMTSGVSSGHHPPALIYGFSGEKKHQVYFRTKHRTRKNSSVS